MRTVKIEEYWPLIVKGTEEFGQIAVAENPEFNQLASCIYDVLKDAFIHDATVYGVSRWENMLGLAVTPDMSLDDRKVAILNYLSVKTPYTWRVLKQMLNSLLGEGNFEMSLDNETATLTVAVALSTTKAQIAEIDSLMDRVLPQNLVTEMEWADGLPMTYTRLEYLESTGTQCINTGLGASNKTEIRCTHRTTVEHDGGSTRYMRLLESQVDADPNMRLTIIQSTLQSSGVKTATWTARFGSASNAFNVNIPDFEIHELFLSAQKLECVDMGRFMSVKDTGEWSNPGGLLIARSFIGCIYSFTLKEAGVLKLNLIPALDPAGRPCMFDTVSCKAFYNAGTGEFGYGVSEIETAASGVYARMVNNELEVIADTEDISAMPIGLDLEDEVTPFVHFNNVGEAYTYFNIEPEVTENE